MVGREPSADVAIATGAPGPDVVDVDTTAGAATGSRALNELKRAGLVDGYHAIVRTPSAASTCTTRGTEQGNGGCPGSYRMDFRSKGGYVVAPPSRDPRGGVRGRAAPPGHRGGRSSWRAIRAHLQPQAAPERPARQPQRQADGDTGRLTGWWGGSSGARPGDRNFPLF